MTIDTTGIAKEIAVLNKAAPKLTELKKATQNFEAIYLKKLFATMRQSTKHVSFGQTLGQDMYNDMFDQAIAESAAKTGNFGIGQLMYKSFAPRVIAMAELQLRTQAAEQAKQLKAVPTPTLTPPSGSPAATTSTNKQQP